MSKPLPDDPPPPLSADPYLNWAVATDFRYARRGTGWVPLLIKLAPGHTVASFAHSTWRSGEPFKDALKIPDQYTKLTGVPSKASFGTALVRIDAITAVLSHPDWDEMVERVLMSQPLSGEPVPLIQQPFSPLMPLSLAVGSGASPVAIAIIDDGIAFAHDRFRLRNGQTRVQAYWNQQHTGTLPDNGAYGRFLTAADIDTALGNCKHAGIVDEDQVYRHLKIEDFSNDEHKSLGRRRAHGTHVLDIAAAIAPNSDATSRPIVAVQLPSRVTADPSGGQLTAYVQDALVYISSRVDEMSAPNAPMPLVVNLSYGMTGGPHDGSHLLEEAIDEFITLRRAAGQKVAVVIPAGNSRQLRGHAHVKIKPGKTAFLPWRLQPDDRTPSTVELWLPAGSAATAPRIEVHLASPSGQLMPPNFGVTEGTTYPSPPSANAVCVVDYTAPPLSGGRRCVLVHLLPTAPPAPLDPVAPIAESGVWQLRIQNAGSKTVTVEAYSQRDDAPVGYRLPGRQSYFDDPMYQRFDTEGRPIDTDSTSSPGKTRRLGTLNAIATGKETIIVGGFRASHGNSSEYASLGPAVTGPQSIRTPPTPDVASISDDSPIAHGVLAAGTRSGSVTAMSGTSVAAPQIARWIADQFSAGQQAGRAQVRAAAAQVEQLLSVMPLPQAAPAVQAIAEFGSLPSNSIGAGRLGLLSTTWLKSGGKIGRNSPIPET